MSYLRSIRTPVVLIAVLSLSSVALFSVNAANIVSHNSALTAAAFRADLRMILATGIVLCAIWVAIVLVGAALAQINVRMERLENRAVDTAPIPRYRIVGTAAVEVAPNPMLDPKVVELGRHIARKITDG